MSRGDDAGEPAAAGARLHVAIVSPYDLAVPGGVQGHVTALGNALVAAGDRVTLVSPGADDSEPIDRVAPGIEVVRTGTTLSVAFNDSRAPVTLDPRALGTVHRILDEADADVVHVHEPAVPMVGLAAAHYDEVPVVGTFHAWSDRQLAYRLARPLLGRMAQRMAGRIAVSKAARDYHAVALGIDGDRFTVVPNGVDVARFRDAEPFPPESQAGSGHPRGGDLRVVLFVGRLEQRKGVDVLVRAFLDLAERRDDCRLVVVGDGPDRRSVQRGLRGLGDRAVLTGRVPADDLARWYRTADVVVAPSLGGESFGIVLLEAMAAGATVVASDIPGYRSVADPDNAVIAPVGDADGLASAIADALDAVTDDTRRAAARATAEAHDWPRVAAQVRAAYVAALHDARSDHRVA